MTTGQTLQSAVRWAASELQHSDSPRVDAELLLCDVAAVTRTTLFAYPEQPLTERQWDRFRDLVARRRNGEPVAYLTGHRSFWTLDLKTQPDTLIPRADTETLVDAVLARTPEDARDVVDLGTGTGAIALALASERPAWQVTGIDRVPAAVALARQNAERHELTRVSFRCSSWCDDLADNSVDILVSNPPYVRADDPHLQLGDVRFEPVSALISGNDGLTDIRHIVQSSVRVLRAGGWLFLEHGYDQADEVALLLIDAGFEHVDRVRDLGNQPRVTLGQRPLRID